MKLVLDPVGHGFLGRPVFESSPWPARVVATSRRPTCTRTRAPCRRAGASSRSAGRPPPGDCSIGMSPFELPNGEDRPPSDAAPDPHRLGGAVVEDVGLREIGDSAACSSSCSAEHWSCRRRARRDAVDVLGDGAHEVAVAARGDVVGEAVRLEVAQQLDHRPVAACGTCARASGASRRQKRVGGGCVGLDAHAPERLEDAGDEDLHVAVVPVIVLRDHPAEPGVVLFARRLPRLLVAQRRVGLRHRGEALRMKPSSIGIGFSHHSVPSLSNTATRAAGATKSGRAGR